MAYFVRHEPCGHCGSRDNLARYSDGSAHCFGCKYNEFPDVYKVLAGENNHKAVHKESILTGLEGLTIDFSREAVGWLAKYNIDVPTALEHDIRWNPSRQQLVFLWKNDNDEIIAWQARNFFAQSKSKYFTQGDVESLLPIYFNAINIGPTKTIVLVEDVISAINVCEVGLDAMPCLSSGLSTNKLSRIARQYFDIAIWLDSNMLHNAQKMGRQLELLGCTTTVIHTPLDPKEYSPDQIKNTIKHLTKV